MAEAPGVRAGVCGVRLKSHVSTGPALHRAGEQLCINWVLPPQPPTQGPRHTHSCRHSASADRREDHDDDAFKKVSISRIPPPWPLFGLAAQFSAGVVRGSGRGLELLFFLCKVAELEWDPHSPRGKPAPIHIHRETATTGPVSQLPSFGRWWAPPGRQGTQPQASGPA